MKTQIFLLLFCFAAVNTFAQKNKSTRAYTNVHHYGNNKFLSNADGTRSSIFVNGSSAMLVNADGSQSTIDFHGNSSTLVAIDGTTSTITHNRFSSRVFNSDGTQMTINHMPSSSSYSTASDKHMITHTFGNTWEMCVKNKLDVLIHRNWIIQKRTAELMAELNEEGSQDQETEKGK